MVNGLDDPLTVRFEIWAVDCTKQNIDNRAESNVRLVFIERSFNYFTGIYLIKYTGWRFGKNRLKG
jgi:hypothetical protein